MKSKTIAIGVPLLILLCIFLSFFWGDGALYAIGDFLIVRDTLEKVDVIHVIAGPDEYTDYAVQLYQEGYGKTIFFTGGWCNIHYDYHGERGRKRALSKGVPVEAIATDDSRVKSTYSEVVRLKNFIDRSAASIQSVIAVSDPYHMRRARWTYRKILGDKIEVRMAPVPFEISAYKHLWWKDSLSRKMVKDEYLKILYYYARYKFSRGWLKDWLASLDRD